MTNILDKKIREVEDEHFEGLEKARIEDYDKDFIYAAHRFHGALGAVTSIARSLSSKMIEGLMEVEDKKYYLAWGFERFTDYLNSDEVPGFSKSKYYNLKALLLSEGADAFDVFSGKKIPVSTRKLLAAKGVEISVDGDDLVIANQRVPITDKAAMKELVETVHDVLRERDAREAKKDSKIEDLSSKISRGTDEYNELRRGFDAMTTGDPYDNALSHAIHSLLELTFRIGQLPNDTKAEKGPDAIDLLWTAMLKVRTSYGVNFAFTENAASQTSKTSETSETPTTGDMVAQVLREDDDFGDEEEA